MNEQSNPCRVTHGSVQLQAFRPKLRCPFVVALDQRYLAQCLERNGSPSNVVDLAIVTEGLFKKRYGAIEVPLVAGDPAEVTGRPGHSGLVANRTGKRKGGFVRGDGGVEVAL